MIQYDIHWLTASWRECDENGMGCHTAMFATHLNETKFQLNLNTVDIDSITIKSVMKFDADESRESGEID